MTDSESSRFVGEPEAECLFLAVLGGRSGRCHLELHDVRFVAGRTIEETFPALCSQWFGSRKGLHLDAWMKVHAIDGWSVSLVQQPQAHSSERLWFVNLGGYLPDSLAELHHFGLVVATSSQAAVARAKGLWLRHAQQRHRDDLWEMDDCLLIDQLDLLSSGTRYVQLLPHPQGLNQRQVPDWCGYRPIHHDGRSRPLLPSQPLPPFRSSS